jgi:ribokinase
MEILVFGSCFIDLIAYGESIPAPGQTLTSTAFAKGFGGKGANQAVAAGRLGARVAMAGCVGSDGDGAAYVASLKKSGVDVRLMRALPDESTGVALIAVDRQGRNAIVICPNAAARTAFAGAAGGGATANVFSSNSFFGQDGVLPRAGGIFIAQNEIPIEATLAALRRRAPRACSPSSTRRPLLPPTRSRCCAPTSRTCR